MKRRPESHPGAASSCPLTRPTYISALALELFLEVLVALRCTLCRLTTDDERHKQLADPMGLEVHDNRDPRPGVVGERFDGHVDVWPDRSVYTVRGPVGGGPAFRDLLRHRTLADNTRSRITVVMDFEGHGIGKLLVPLIVRRQAAKRAPQSYQRLKEQLERQS